VKAFVDKGDKQAKWVGYPVHTRDEVQCKADNQT